MKAFDAKNTKISALRTCFAPLIGSRLTRFETAQGCVDNELWFDWPDLPIRLFFDSDQVASVAWSHSETLWLSNDLSVNFSLEGSRYRWIENGIQSLFPALNGKLQSVALGLDEDERIGPEFEFWTRVLIKFDIGWLEVSNGGDENAYSFSIEQPSAPQVTCCGS